MSHEISLSNEQSRHPINETQLIDAARAVLADSPFSSAMISLVVVDDAAIHELNRQYLDHDWPTDVLSFVLDDSAGRIEGEVIISADTAAEAAAELGCPAAAEQLLYVIHGMLHLVGYRDKTPSDADEMRAAEAKFLRQFGFEPSFDAEDKADAAIVPDAKHSPNGAPTPVNVDALFWLSIVGLLAACVTAIAARSLRSFSRSELEDICQSRENPERFAEILRHHERVALGVEMFVMVFVGLALSAGMLWIWQSLAAAATQPWLTFAIAAIVLGQLAAITTVWLPWSIARIGASKFLYVTWPLWNVVGKLAEPLVLAARGVDALLHRFAGRAPQEANEDSIEEEIRTIVSEGHREGLLEEEAREMIEGVIELGDANVSHIMTPRTDINMIHVDTAWDEVVETVIESGHTRVPVYGSSRDEIVGILYSKDLLPELAKPTGQPPRPLAELLRKPLFVPETKPVDDLLNLFQKSRTHIAVVLDEFGGVSGLVTIEDALEEIVGEIDDEYDQKSEVQIRKIDDDTCEALGRTHVDEINSVMAFDLPEDEDFDTIGGFVFAEFGRVPAVGESITWQDAVRVTVLEASRRRVNKVRLERVRKESLEAV